MSSPASTLCRAGTADPAWRNVISGGTANDWCVERPQSTSVAAAKQAPVIYDLQTAVHGGILRRNIPVLSFRVWPSASPHQGHGLL
ncbi:hypothetical protein E4U34_003544 [Claviceps purpurea]|nr:hypothetical protein E4U11_005167 [Claviceps purpurea]KAG6162536.1 hypothetical protein E4U51_006343 [Claviceps purpurea]KAG6180650.1 hypothetical protein E4U36_004694 [Claviceps purpurea]KAG6183398.1 hypothetical protein E4U27_001390 [Claviceps purpurea]KAG6219541.1 hypothetical protein E4U34_003544 [Claviceps purpurea]